MNKLVALGVDTYKGVITEYSQKDASEVLRKELNELAGFKDGKFDARTFRENAPKVFRIIEETIDVLAGEGIEGMFDRFAEVKTIGAGDQFKFKIPNTDLYEVSVVADGTQNLQRQYIKAGKDLVVTTKPYGVKIYEELRRFLAGRIDWVDMVNRVAKSFAQQLANDIYNAIYNVYSKLRTEYVFNGTFALDKMVEIASRVETLTGEDVIILGTKKALSKISPAQISDRAKDEFNAQGFYGRVAGYDLMAMPQALKLNQHEFAIADDFLLILPATQEKFVKILLEGDAWVQEDSGQNQTGQLEYVITKSMGVEILVTNQFGMMKLA